MSKATGYVDMRVRGHMFDAVRIARESAEANCVGLDDHEMVLGAVLYEATGAYIETAHLTNLEVLQAFQLALNMVLNGKEKQGARN